jgi:hypothetical protein
MTNDKDDDAMLTARKIVEDHIEFYGMVPHPDRMKERIAGALRNARFATKRSGMLRDHSCWKCLDGKKSCVIGNPLQRDFEART